MLIVSNEVSGTISAYALDFATASFQSSTGLLKLPEVTVGGTVYQGNMELVDSQELIFALDTDSVLAVNDNAGIVNGQFADGVLTLDRVDVGGQTYGVELELVGVNQFEVSSLSLI
jgi:hypothetical protein